MANFIQYETKHFSFPIPSQHNPIQFHNQFFGNPRLGRPAGPADLGLRPSDFSSPQFSFGGKFCTIFFKPQEKLVYISPGFGAVSSNTTYDNWKVSMHFYCSEPGVLPNILAQNHISCDTVVSESKVLGDNLFLDVLVKGDLQNITPGVLELSVPFAATLKTVEFSVRWKNSQNATVLDYHRHISQQFMISLKDKSYCDAMLSVKGHDIPAHRLILAAHSPVFRAMFDTDMQEKSGNVSINYDLEPEGVKGMIEFMYSPILEVFPFESYRSAIEIYKCSHKYEVHILTQNCSAYLQEVIDEDNVLDILQLASVYSDATLKEAALKFIFDHPHAVDDDIKCQTVNMTCPGLFQYLLQHCKLK